VVQDTVHHSSRPLLGQIWVIHLFTIKDVLRATTITLHLIMGRQDLVGHRTIVHFLKIILDGKVKVEILMVAVQIQVGVEGGGIAVGIGW
jgi:hypothetical protein